MATKTKNKQAFQIPAEHLEEIKSLSGMHDTEELRIKCAKARLKNAIQAGDLESAVKEKAACRTSAVDYELAHGRLWARIHEVVPSLEEDGVYSIDVSTWEIEESRGRGMGGLASMFDRMGEDED